MKEQEEDFVIEINSSTDISKSRMKGKKKPQRNESGRTRERWKTDPVATNFVNNEYLKTLIGNKKQSKCTIGGNRCIKYNISVYP